MKLFTSTFLISGIILHLQTNIAEAASAKNLSSPGSRTIDGDPPGPSISWHDKMRNLVWRVFPGYGYQEEEFRPSADGEEETPQPTSVEIYLRDLRVLNANPYYPGKASMQFTADLIMEYTDPRRTFDPSEFNNAQVVRMPQYGRIWSPELRCYNVSYAQNSYWYTLTANTNREVLVSSLGRVFIRSPVQISLEGWQGDPYYSAGSFKMQISPQLYTVDEVKLLWKVKNPIGIVSGSTDDSYETFLSTGTCKRTEDDGSLGVRKFGCLELNIRVRRNYVIDSTTASTFPTTTSVTI